MTGAFIKNRLLVTHGTTAAAWELNNGVDLSWAGFVLAYDLNGTPLWSARMNSPGTDAAQSSAPDMRGNVFVSGHYTTANLQIYNRNDTGTATTVPLDSSKYGNFITKYNSAGDVQWAVRINGGIPTAFTDDLVNSIATDSTGNVVIAGITQTAAVTLYDTAGNSQTLTYGGAWDSWLGKYDTNGILLWAARIGGAQSDVSHNIAVDPVTNDSIVVGWYGGTSSAGQIFYNKNGVASSYSVPSTASASINFPFIARYTSDGYVRWAFHLKGTLDGRAWHSVFDDQGSLIVVGFFTGNLNITGLAGTTSVYYASVGNYDGWIAYFNTAGEMVWTARIGGTAMDMFTAAYPDSNGDIFATGFHKSTSAGIYLGSSATAVKTMTACCGDARFIAKFSKTGQLLWTVRLHLLHLQINNI
jgi:hypothetical protein